MDFVNLMESVGDTEHKYVFLISDNVLQDGDIIESRYAVRRRDRTIHSRMRDYLYEIKHNPELESSILPVGDGVTISVKKG